MSLTGGLLKGTHCTFCQCVCPTKSVHGTVVATITADQTPNPIRARDSAGRAASSLTDGVSECRTFGVAAEMAVTMVLVGCQGGYAPIVSSAFFASADPSKSGLSAKARFNDWRAFSHAPVWT